MRAYTAESGNTRDAAAQWLPDVIREGPTMTKKEEFELAVQLAAHERLLAELLILVRERPAIRRKSCLRICSRQLRA